VFYFLSNLEGHSLEQYDVLLNLNYSMVLEGAHQQLLILKEYCHLVCCVHLRLPHTFSVAKIH